MSLARVPKWDLFFIKIQGLKTDSLPREDVGWKA
jgi:hypothetical protein